MVKAQEESGQTLTEFWLIMGVVFLGVIVAALTAFQPWKFIF